ncbi:tol-pal system YbgF family protein [Haloferula sp. A504]|uniref:tol-pal system YbgF family protein n=1 Tax=Haloferula sp. A504 TaxID=3373601 RepID=UPI0031C30FA7|nr:tetratricopeptide repeat protein [Verrucomicrobiaceae bacterium E54]
MNRATTTALLIVPLLTILSPAQETGEGERSRPTADVDREAKHLYDKAIELMEYKQYERGLAMLNTVVRDNQGNLLSHMAHMAMGKHFLDQNNSKEALGHFLLLTRVLAPVPGEKQSEDEIALYHEALFQAGFSHFQAGQYASCFPLFRRLTEVAGRTKWANMAYYYIGMSHYQLKNWNKAIDSLSLVGTEVEDAGSSDSEDLGRIEIGQRFYSKIEDADVPIMRKLGVPVTATVEVSSGDKETITGVPVPGKKHEMLASAPTALGEPKAGDGVIQMVGGDTLTVTYIDDSTLDGQKGVPRTGKVRAVSTGTVGFFLGDFSTPAYVAYPGQPQVLMLRDADLDKSPNAEAVTLTVTSRFKVEAKEAAESDDLLDIFALEDEEEDAWKERDSITVRLEETGEGPQIRTGTFLGRVELAAVEDGISPDASDNVLHCDELDELIVTYTDEVHLYGDEPRETESVIKVSGSVNSGVSADQYVVFEELLKARKGSVEAEALVGLGEIYKDMGLDQRAALRARESLDKVDPIIMTRDQLPGDLVENAFRLKWESELLRDDFDAATATCLAFNRLYPESVLADQALMTLGRSLTDKGQYEKAVDVYGRVLELENPISAAEAQFRIGEALARKAEEEAEAADEHNSKWGKAGLSKATALQNRMSAAINAYRRTYENYPESAFAAEALGRVVRHYVETESFAQAANLLESVFADYPDAAFLDEMLLLWANVAFRMGDNETAKGKLQQLIFDYPTSSHVAEARSRLAGLAAESGDAEEE